MLWSVWNLNTGLNHQKKTRTEVHVKMKGYKSFRRKIKKMRKDIEKLNVALEKNIELKKCYEVSDSEESR